jgi:serine/threonine-protein kinase
MSPEQAQGNRTVDLRTDLWAMGVIAFECLTGKRPFYSDGLGDLVLAICVRDIPQPSSIASVPIGFDAWWNRAVARDPEKRFQSAKELTDALREALGLEPRDLVRESPLSSPQIEVSSGPRTDRDTPPTDPMLVGSVGPGSPSISVRADDLAEPHAATVVAPPAPADAPAYTVRQFSTTQMSPPSVPPRSDGAGLVIGVAAAALFVGLIAGVMLLRSHNQAEADQHRALPAPLPDPGRQTSEPRVKSKAAAQPSASPAPPPSAPDKKPVLEFLPGDAPTTSAATATPPAALVEPRPSSKQEAPATSASAAPPADGNLPDGGWVKPEWAIPDGDPVRRAPITE